MVFILILKVQSTLFSRANTRKMHIFISKLSHKSPSIQIQEKWPKFQNLPVQVKIFTEAEPRGIPASVKLIPIPHFELQPPRIRILIQELSQQIKDNSHPLFFTPYSVRDKEWVSFFYQLNLFLSGFLEVHSFSLSGYQPPSSLSLLVFSVVCCLKQNHIGFPLKTLSIFA